MTRKRETNEKLPVALLFWCLLAHEKLSKISVKMLLSNIASHSKPIDDNCFPVQSVLDWYSIQVFRISLDLAHSLIIHSQVIRPWHVLYTFSMRQKKPAKYLFSYIERNTYKRLKNCIFLRLRTWKRRGWTLKCEQIVITFFNKHRKNRHYSNFDASIFHSFSSSTKHFHR